MTETTTRTPQEIRREIQSIVWAAGECRRCAGYDHRTYRGPHNEGCRRLDTLMTEMPGKVMAWQRALDRLPVEDREDPDPRWWAEGPAPAPAPRPRRISDRDLWLMHQTGGGTHPRTGQVQGLGYTRLSQRTGLSVSVIRRRLARYTAARG